MSWEECGNLALKELPTEIRLLLARTGTLEGELCFGILPFLVRTENNIHLVEIYSIIITYYQTLRTKELTLRSMQQLTTPIRHLLLLKLN